MERRFVADPRKVRALVFLPLGFAAAFAAVAGVLAWRAPGTQFAGMFFGATAATLALAGIGAVVWRVLAGLEIVLTEDTVRSRGGGHREVVLHREAVEAIVHYPKGKVAIRGRGGRGWIHVSPYLADREALLAAVSTWAPKERGWIEPGMGPVTTFLGAAGAYLVVRDTGGSTALAVAAGAAVVAVAALLHGRRRRRR